MNCPTCKLPGTLVQIIYRPPGRWHMFKCSRPTCTFAYQSMSDGLQTRPSLVGWARRRTTKRNWPMPRPDPPIRIDLIPGVGIHIDRGRTFFYGYVTAEHGELKAHETLNPNQAYQRLLAYRGKTLAVTLGELPILPLDPEQYTKADRQFKSAKGKKARKQTT